MPVHVLIVDDELLARQRARDAVESLEGFEVAAECANGIEAVAAIETGGLDLVLLDVRMPGLDGLEVVERVGQERMPPIVFLTAFDDYAVRAFDVRAVDYVEKPWAFERLATALRRGATEAVRRREAVAGGQAEPTREEGGRAGEPALLLRAGGRVVVLRLAEVDWIESAANYARVHGRDGEYLTRETMAALAGRLPETRFARIHRSTIVALAAVREVLPDGEGELAVVLRDGTRLRCSRSYRAAIEGYLGDRGRLDGA